jgi:alanyl-tRNA synthetase
MKNAVFWVLRRAALVRTDVSEECNAFNNTVKEGIKVQEESASKTRKEFNFKFQGKMKAAEGVTLRDCNV